MADVQLTHLCASILLIVLRLHSGKLTPVTRLDCRRTNILIDYLCVEIDEYFR